MGECRRRTGTGPDALLRQLTTAVRFAETLTAMAAAGIDTFVHIGPGDVTAGLARRTVPDATVHVVMSLEDVDEVAGAVR
jgi:[acyl-carrier-protein] S-malonyltransferase